MKFKIGDKVIIRSYNGHEWKGIIDSELLIDDSYEYYEYYMVLKPYRMVSLNLEKQLRVAVNSIKIRLDREYYRKQKIARVFGD